MSTADQASASRSSGESDDEQQRRDRPVEHALRERVRDVPAAAAATASDGCGIVVDVDRLPVGVDVERLGARPRASRCPSRATPPNGMCGSSRRSARSPCDAACDDPARRTPGRGGRSPSRSRRSGRTGESLASVDRLLEAADAVQRRDRPEQLGAGRSRVGVGALDQRRRHEEAAGRSSRSPPVRTVAPAAFARSHRGAACARAGAR